MKIQLLSKALPRNYKKINIEKKDMENLQGWKAKNIVFDEGIDFLTTIKKGK